MISKEPLAPAVRQGDDEWFDIVKWSLFAMIEAEERGITSENVDEMLKSRDPERPAHARRHARHRPGARPRRGVGVQDHQAGRQLRRESSSATSGMGSKLELPRGLNAQWTKGGLHVRAADPLSETAAAPAPAAMRRRRPRRRARAAVAAMTQPHERIAAAAGSAPSVAWWNDRRIRAVLYQLAVLGGVVAARRLSRLQHARPISKRGTSRPASASSAGKPGSASARACPLHPADTYFRALVVGVLNTLLRLGARHRPGDDPRHVVGVARLSRNWLIARLAGVYVESAAQHPACCFSCSSGTR